VSNSLDTIYLSPTASLGTHVSALLCHPGQKEKFREETQKLNVFFETGIRFLMVQHLGSKKQTLKKSIRFLMVRELDSEPKK